MAAVGNVLSLPPTSCRHSDDSGRQHTATLVVVVPDPPSCIATRPAMAGGSWCNLASGERDECVCVYASLASGERDECVCVYLYMVAGKSADMI